MDSRQQGALLKQCVQGSSCPGDVGQTDAFLRGRIVRVPKSSALIGVYAWLDIAVQELNTAIAVGLEKGLHHSDMRLFVLHKAIEELMMIGFAIGDPGKYLNLIAEDEREIVDAVTFILDKSNPQTPTTWVLPKTLFGAFLSNARARIRMLEYMLWRLAEECESGGYDEACRHIDVSIVRKLAGYVNRLSNLLFELLRTEDIEELSFDRILLGYEVRTD